MNKRNSITLNNLQKPRRWKLVSGLVVASTAGILYLWSWDKSSNSKDWWDVHAIVATRPTIFPNEQSVVEDSSKDIWIPENVAEPIEREIVINPNLLNTIYLARDIWKYGIEIQKLDHDEQKELLDLFLNTIFIIKRRFSPLYLVLCLFLCSCCSERRVSLWESAFFHL